MMNKKYEEMTVEELQAELKKIRDNLCDLEDQHAFTFLKTSVHIGAEKAHKMQMEFDEECREFSGRISRVEQLLAERGA
jgi:ribosomal protein L29